MGHFSTTECTYLPTYLCACLPRRTPAMRVPGWSVR